MDLNQRMPRVDASRFAMVPRADIPRSTFVTTHSCKSTFDAAYLVPIYVGEVLPGDVHQGSITVFARVANLLFPIMDHLELETFAFFCPMRLLWSNAKAFFGERQNPSSSISYSIPGVTSPGGGWPVGSLADYFGLPTIGQVNTQYNANALPFRMYNFVWNEWFRDQNLQDSLTVNQGNGADPATDYTLMRRNKKHDYFTSALPWPLKGGVDVTLPMSGQANVLGLAIGTGAANTAGDPGGNQAGNVATTAWTRYYDTAGDNLFIRSSGAGAGAAPIIYADLSTATGQTINALRLAIQTQRLLERDARSGTRYTELLRSHFGVTPEDTRLQRPEYIGGGRTPVQTQAIPQTSATSVSGSTTALGSLSGQGTISDEHSYSYHAKEHGYIMVLANVRAALTYSQGLHRMWTRSTRYDFYWPVFAHLGEQAIRNDELYMQATAADSSTFGYQERWAEYRYEPSRITGLFRPTSTGNIDEWHLSEQFGSLPTLNNTFMYDASDAQLRRALAAGASANGMQILFDSVFRIKKTRAMPMFSVPGMIDRF